VQVPGFEDIGLPTHGGRLVCDFCSSGQCFAFGFLQIPPRGGHPDLRYHDTNEDKEHIAFLGTKSIADSRVVFTISRSF